MRRVRASIIYSSIINRREKNAAQRASHPEPVFQVAWLASGHGVPPNRGRTDEKMKKLLTKTCHHVNMLKCIDVIVLKK